MDAARPLTAAIPAPRKTTDSLALLGDRSVALVHEWFSAFGGSENVFLALAGLLPHAPPPPIRAVGRGGRPRGFARAAAVVARLHAVAAQQGAGAAADAAGL